MTAPRLAWAAAGLGLLAGLWLWMEMGLAVALSEGAWFCAPGLG